MGVLYRALDTRLDRTVAIKILRPDAVGDPQRKRCFVQEAKAASALNHPNIVTIYDIDNTKEKPVSDEIFQVYKSIYSYDRTERLPPEVEAINFAPRAKMPVLMLNGRYDFESPVETSQLPLFRLLGAPEKDKRHVLFDSGHVLSPKTQVIKEILDWLDRYPGPVKLGVIS